MSTSASGPMLQQRPLCQTSVLKWPSTITAKPSVGALSARGAFLGSGSSIESTGFFIGPPSNSNLSFFLRTAAIALPWPRPLSRRRLPETYGASLLKINIKCIGAHKFLRAFLPSGSIRQVARRPSGYFVPYIRPATRAAGNCQASATYAESEIEIVNERIKP
jgi:hypothetical protein